MNRQDKPGGIAVGDYYRADRDGQHIAMRIDDIRDGVVYWLKFWPGHHGIGYRSALPDLAVAIERAGGVQMTEDEARAWDAEHMAGVPELRCPSGRR